MISGYLSINPSPSILKPDNLPSSTNFIPAKKGTLSISDYFINFKVITDSLAAIQCPVSDEDKVLHILSGLGPSYEMFVTSSVCAKPPMPTFEDLRALLLNQEIRLSQTSQSSQSPPSPPPDSSLSGTAMFSQRGRGRGVPGRGRSRGYRGRGRGFYNPGRGPNSYYGRGYVNPGRGFYSFSGRDSDYSSSSGSSFAGPPDMGRGFRYPPHLAGLLGPGPASSPAVACQVCGKPGHSALDCYHRFNQAYQSEPPTQAFAAMSITSPGDPNWYPDTGASSHMTGNSGNFSSLRP